MKIKLKLKSLLEKCRMLLAICPACGRRVYSIATKEGKKRIARSKKQEAKMTDE